MLRSPRCWGPACLLRGLRTREYSNFGYALLGRIITNVSGRPSGLHRAGSCVRSAWLRPAMTSRVTASAGDRLSLGERGLGARAGHGAWRVRRDGRGGDQRRAIMRAGSLSCSRPGRRATDRNRDRCARDGARADAGVNFPTRRAPRWTRRAVPPGPRLRHGLRCAGLRPRPRAPHGGGYPGYGSFMLLCRNLARRSSRWPTGPMRVPSSAVWDVAVELRKAGWLLAAA